MISNRLKERYEETQKERQKEHDDRNIKIGGGQYWYIWGYRTGNGRPFIRGIYNSEKEAEQREYTMTDAINTHIVSMNTRDFTEAGRKIRALIADETNSVGQAMRRFKRTYEDKE